MRAIGKILSIHQRRRANVELANGSVLDCELDDGVRGLQCLEPGATCVVLARERLPPTVVHVTDPAAPKLTREHLIRAGVITAAE
jgi:hypothetical protein